MIFAAVIYAIAGLGVKEVDMAGKMKADAEAEAESPSRSRDEESGV